MDDLNDIQFQPLIPELYPIYIQIGEKSYNQHYRHLWPNGNTSTYIENSFTNAVLHKEEKDLNTKLYLVKLGVLYVGILKITLHKKVGQHKALEALYLDKIYILKEYSGKGIGRMCIEFVADLAKNLSKKAIYLESMKKGAALSFYLSHNFTVVASTKVPFEKVIETEKDMYLLMKKL